MANRLEGWTWTLLGAGSGLGGILLASGCAGNCGSCFGCVGGGLLLTTAALLRRHRPANGKGDHHGLAARSD